MRHNDWAFNWAVGGAGRCRKISYKVITWGLSWEVTATHVWRVAKTRRQHRYQTLRGKIWRNVHRKKPLLSLLVSKLNLNRRYLKVKNFFNHIVLNIDSYINYFLEKEGEHNVSLYTYKVSFYIHVCCIDMVKYNEYCR